MKVLVIEDEVGISKPLCKMLERSNIHTDAVYDGLSGYMQGSRDIYDVIILDIMLPEMDGLEVLRKLRADGVLTPILLLTAKDTVDDKVAGLNLGADDYLTKPFVMDELIARVKALSRRRADVFSPDIITVGDVTLNVSGALLTVGESSEVIPAKEAHILEILMRNKGNVISKDYLLDAVWGFDSEATDNTVEIYVHYVRKKLAGSGSVSIVTQRSLGYVLREKDD
ncbi:MAG: response regulator transcription factor [Eubacteriaceae bacterium]|nr:response regulator transcription factor [Eubacteriaceae bacterium]